MDRQKAKVIREKLNTIMDSKVFKDLLNVHGLDDMNIELGNARFDSSEVTYKLTLREEGALTKEEQDLAFFAEHDGVDVSKIATIQGDKFALKGYRIRASKKPYIIQKLDIGGDSSEYIITTDMAKKYFGKVVA